MIIMHKILFLAILIMKKNYLISNLNYVTLVLIKFRVGMKNVIIVKKKLYVKGGIYQLFQNKIIGEVMKQVISLFIV